MQIFRLFLVFSCLLVITGCPTEFQKLEENYYKDNFFEAATQLAKLAETQNANEKANTEEFLRRNGPYLKRELSKNIHYLFLNPDVSGVEKTRQLNDDLKILAKKYPTLFTPDFISLNEKTYKDLLSRFSDTTIADTQLLLSQKKYRQSHENLSLLFEKRALPQNWISVKEQLAPLLPRQLYVYPPKVHDLSIEDLQKSSPDAAPFDYESAPSRLVYNGFSIPTKLKEDLIKNLNKKKSTYLSLSNLESAQYSLQYRVGLHIDEDIIESKKEVFDTFKVKYSGSTQWVNAPVSYEVYTSTKQVHIVIDAQVFFAKDKSLVSHYIFETLMPQEKHRIGEMTSDMTDVIEVEQSAQYNQYKYGTNNVYINTLVENAIDDAALVLSYKVLDTIDSDPDPYILKLNPTVTEPK